MHDKTYTVIINQIKLKDVRTTFDIIKLAQEGRLPDVIMFNTHPQRWTDNALLWLKELVMQNLKNGIKRIIVLKNLK